MTNLTDDPTGKILDMLPTNPDLASIADQVLVNVTLVSGRTLQRPELNGHQRYLRKFRNLLTTATSRIAREWRVDAMLGGGFIASVVRKWAIRAGSAWPISRFASYFCGCVKKEWRIANIPFTLRAKWRGNWPKCSARPCIAGWSTADGLVRVRRSQTPKCKIAIEPFCAKLIMIAAGIEDNGWRPRRTTTKE